MADIDLFSPGQMDATVPAFYPFLKQEERKIGGTCDSSVSLARIVSISYLPPRKPESVTLINPRLKEDQMHEFRIRCGSSHTTAPPSHDIVTNTSEGDTPTIPRLQLRK